MRARRGAVFTLVILALTLGAAACGGTSAKTTTSQVQLKAAEVHWRVGLGRWRASMLRALDGISLIFSRQDSLARLATRHSATSVRLEGYEVTLANCTVVLRQLGPVPQRLQLSSRYAGQACESLQQGVRLVLRAVSQLGRVASVNPLDQASVPLGAGQSELTTATRAAVEVPPT
jgi:hypothetical protein